jgi:hypothetical protein
MTAPPLVGFGLARALGKRAGPSEYYVPARRAEHIIAAKSEFRRCWYQNDLPPRRKNRPNPL